MMQDRFNYLIERLSAKNISAEELEELQGILNNQDENELVEQNADLWLKEPLTGISEKVDEAKIHANAEAILETDRITQAPVRKIEKWKWAAAAAIIVSGTVITFLLLRPAKNNNTEIVNNQQHIVQPGGDKAILTLSDGRTIILDSAGSGELAEQGNSNIIKLENGEVVYKPKNNSGNAVMNTMSTPRGGTYQLTLPDGTKVWLNAASSITFPSSFTGHSRNVKIKGEVFMDIAQVPSKPFIVDIDARSTIEVLGTQFNVNSYNNENAIRTTLLTGSIKVSANGKQVLLKPGQQAFSSNEKMEPVMLNNINTQQIIAWKNGYFDMNNLSFREVAKQLERWYDIEVKYEGNVPDTKFEGKLSRDLQLQQMIQILEKVEIKFRLEGKTLIVYSPEKNKT